MESINEAALIDVLHQLESACPAFSGAVVATRDGLVLAFAGGHRGDTPAACAASMAFHLQDDLQHLTADGETGPREALVFGACTTWYLSRLRTDHLLLIESRQTVHAGAVRLAGQTATSRLNRWLGDS